MAMDKHNPWTNTIIEGRFYSALGAFGINEKAKR
jgi:hypothetical protein